MNDRTGYKSRVSTVRGRARAQLSAIRKARLARKRAMPEQPGTSAPEARQPQMPTAEHAGGPVHAEGAAAPSRPEIGAEANRTVDAPKDSTADREPDPQDLTEPADPPAPDAPAMPDLPEMAGAAAEADEGLAAQVPPAEDAPELPARRDMDGPPGALREGAALAEFTAPDGDQVRPAPAKAVEKDEAMGNPAPVMAADMMSGTPCPGLAMSAATGRAAGGGLPQHDAMQDGDHAGRASPAPPGDQGFSPEMPSIHGQGRSHDPEEASSRATGGETGSAASAERGGSDLHEIPGIGSGLVWMLQSAGVASLDDLARSDARTLGLRLGMISRLLDLDYFVAQARTLTSANDRD